MATSAKQQSLEQKIARLEEIVAELESGEVPLEKSIGLYEEGRKLGGECMEKLGALEQRVMKVVQAADGELAAEPFDVDA